MTKRSGWLKNLQIPFPPFNSSYVQSHKELNLDRGPNYEFLGSPINAYHFVRHVASGWKSIQENVIGDGSILNDLVALKEREEEKLPDEYDIKGSYMSFHSKFILISSNFG